MNDEQKRCIEWASRKADQLGYQGMAETFHALLAASASAEPVAWRHSKTHCLFDTEEEVPLADGDEWAEPLYLAPRPIEAPDNSQPVIADTAPQYCPSCGNHVAIEADHEEWCSYLEWKKRALEAEELNRKFMASVNGPTHMGEPVIADTAGAKRLETTSEHIARDIREGRFPQRSEPQTIAVPSLSAPASMSAEPECTCSSNPHLESCPVTEHVRNLFAQSGECAQGGASMSAENRGAPFSNCKFRECDLPGQCIGEGACHHPKAESRGEEAAQDDVDGPAITADVHRDAQRWRVADRFELVSMDTQWIDEVIARDAAIASQSAKEPK